MNGKQVRIRDESYIRGEECNTPNFRIGSGLKFSNWSSDFGTERGWRIWITRWNIGWNIFIWRIVVLESVRFRKPVTRFQFGCPMREKFMISVIEISNELRLSRFHFRWTRFSETNNFRVGNFSKFAQEGLQNVIFPIWPKFGPFRNFRKLQNGPNSGVISEICHFEALRGQISKSVQHESCSSRKNESNGSGI